MNKSENPKKKTKKEAKTELARAKRHECKHDFALEIEYMGIITCPYCGKYVEG